MPEKVGGKRVPAVLENMSSNHGTVRSLVQSSAVLFQSVCESLGPEPSGNAVGGYARGESARGESASYQVTAEIAALFEDVRAN